MNLIHTIDDFKQLDQTQRDELQKALKVKKRLETYLLAKARLTDFEPYDVDCTSCRGGKKHKKPRDATAVHPSSVDRCIKVMWYEAADWWRGQPWYTQQASNKYDSRMQLLFDWGTALHETLQSYGKDGAWGDPADYYPEHNINPGSPGEPNNEFPMASQLWVKGHIDAIVDNYIVEAVPTIGDVNVRMVHEYKSMRQHAYSKLTSPKREHKWQAMIYAAIYNVPIVTYLYVGKDDSAMMDYPVGFDEVLWADIQRKIERVQELVQKWSLPPWKETAVAEGGYECKSCKYKTVCNPPAPKPVPTVPKLPTTYSAKSKRRFR